MKRLLRWTGQLVLAFVLLVLLLQFWYFAHIVWWTRFDPVSTSFMRAQHDTLRERDPDASLKHRWIAYDQISPHLKRAVIAAEDANFTEHDGVDWDAIERAYESNLKKGTVVRGGSTITMQLAKNLFLSGERSYLRKAQELVITYMLESMMSKRRILEIYLNVAEWGVGVFGCEAAARHHFGTSCAQLAPAQAARLAAMLPRPRYYDRNRASPALARRTSIVLRWMGGVTPP
ncbi:MAG TPA: monofunctional biosynthetic peptidoglycan transglycosylase [Quisquiliibacterium sp.]|nr:monofunctional biosynthetic peptidoglycan transglycosylase [Quisquiliibacterium sp.]HPA89933.1 monofunctional biosynthetic peptidoglycan transglycosylase [Quisquiliibacterium sp.]HQD82915.1 monofunctional biosynthetic peptidoglycan transglycosylase [Quisquiliibacterium sp.]HQP65997.1 monofunctional biosynthetic peptidoglycan transglycosylase [Quisquiliibacterium sp.]